MEHEDVCSGCENDIPKGVRRVRIPDGSVYHKKKCWPERQAFLSAVVNGTRKMLDRTR